MSFYTVKVTLPAVELTVCAADEEAATQGAWEFVSTAFANALRFWDQNEPIADGGTVNIAMADEGEIELAVGDIEITEQKEARQ